LVLAGKDEATGMHCLAYRLDDTEAVLEAGLAAGQLGYCTDCTGDESKPERGYRATVRGTVTELGSNDSSDGFTGMAHVLGDIELLDDSVECETTIVDPVCMAPVPEAPTPAVVPPVVDGPTTDCTQEFCEFQLEPGYTLRYLLNEDSITMEVIYDGEAWVAIAWSEDGQMIGSEAVM
jgi:hypothetical protein